MLEFVRIARAIILLKDFLTVAENISERMIGQGGSKYVLLKQIKKAFS